MRRAAGFVRLLLAFTLLVGCATPRGAPGAVTDLKPGERPALDSDAQRAHVGALVQASGKTFEELWRARAAANPAKRYGRPTELGAYCAFLCSEHAGFITGQNLLIDGGSYPGTH